MTSNHPCGCLFSIQSFTTSNLQMPLKKREKISVTSKISAKIAQNRSENPEKNILDCLKRQQKQFNIKPRQQRKSLKRTFNGIENRFSYKNSVNPQSENDILIDPLKQSESQISCQQKQKIGIVFTSADQKINILRKRKRQVCLQLVSIDRQLDKLYVRQQKLESPEQKIDRQSPGFRVSMKRFSHKHTI